MDDLEAAERLRRGFTFDQDDSLGSLREVTEARRALAVFEGFLVRRARRDAATWADIGAALGITRQAAHRRHASRVNAVRRLRDESETTRRRRG